MAQRRMFSLSVVDTDSFLDLPLSSQALYFHLGMRADDDGFLGNAKTVQRTVGASADDLKLLIAKGLLIEFESGVCVIRDWDTNNYIRNDRYHATRYLAEKSMLSRTNGYYALSLCQPTGSGAVAPVDTVCIPSGSQVVYQNGDLVYQRYTSGIPTGSGAVAPVDTEVRLGKDRLGEDTSCAEPPEASHAPSVPPVFQIPLNDKTLFPVTADMIARWRELYPAVNVEQTMRDIIGWSEANPKKRKTKGGVMRFINAWLAKEQDNGGKGYQNAAYAPQRANEPRKERPSDGFKIIS